VKPLNLDEQPENADWLRGLEWDLPTDPDVFIASVLGTGPIRQQRAELAAFLRLPAARPMPAELRAELARRGLMPDREAASGS